MLFLLSSGGKFNYFGSKRYIEESLENSAYSNNAHYSNSLLSNAKLVVCLEALTSMKQQDGPDALNLHVSKPPKQGSVAYDIYSNIQNVCLFDYIINYSYFFILYTTYIIHLLCGLF